MYNERFSHLKPLVEQSIPSKERERSPIREVRGSAVNQSQTKPKEQQIMQKAARNSAERGGLEEGEEDPNADHAMDEVEAAAFEN